MKPHGTASLTEDRVLGVFVNDIIANRTDGFVLLTTGRFSGTLCRGSTGVSALAGAFERWHRLFPVLHERCHFWHYAYNNNVLCCLPSSIPPSLTPSFLFSLIIIQTIKPARTFYITNECSITIHVYYLVYTVYCTYTTLYNRVIGLGTLCWHNFEHNSSYSWLEHNWA